MQIVTKPFIPMSPGAFIMHVGELLSDANPNLAGISVEAQNCFTTYRRRLDRLPLGHDIALLVNIESNLPKPAASILAVLNVLDRAIYRYRWQRARFGL